MKWRWMMIMLISSLNVDAQTKWWDGESGDGQWTNARNWFPDGVPSFTDRVILDHHFLQNGYSVTLPDGNIAVEANQIVIGEQASDTIKLIIPESNTISPAIAAYDPMISIQIKDRGMLINCSGANAGNTFQLSGNMRIENGGTYLHQTMRGTAAIVSKMQMDNATATGIFTVDVPGTSGYILSLSGRTYGTLTLSADRSGGKRTYSGSGNNTLDIQGDLNIQKGTSLITTLNGNIQIYGGLYNEGTLQLNPTNTDTIARSIIFKGKASSVTNLGIVNCNAFMRKIDVDSNASLQLKSNFEVMQSGLIFEVNGRLICDSFYLNRLREFKSNPGTWIETSSPTVLSTDATQGCIRNTLLNIDNHTNFSCKGEGIQHTGNAFPDSISTLAINKNSGMLLLDKSLHVKDSIALIHGVLKSDKEHLLSFSGINIKARSPFTSTNTEYDGYISGEMKYDARTTDSLYFPLGDDASFAPCFIHGIANNAYLVGFDAKDHLQQLPLKYNQKTLSHWHIQRMSIQDSTIKREKISLFMGNIPLNKREQPIIIFKNNIDSNWIGKPQTAFNNQTIFLQSQPMFISDGVYTIASQFYDALPLERIHLFLKEHNGTKDLRWVTIMDEMPLQFIVEKSVNGNAFTSIHIKPDQIVHRNNEYQMTLPLVEASGYFRVTADIGERNIISNIIHVNDFNTMKAFPNPAFEQFNLQLEKAYTKNLFALTDMMGKRYPLNIKWNGSTASIDVRHLTSGQYVLILREGEQTKTWTFIKG